MTAMKTQNQLEIVAKRNLLKRSNSRGVSMVEGALVLPVLTIFFALMQFVHAEYDTKLLTSWDAQNQAWAYSSHGCQGGQGVVAGEPNQAANDAEGDISNGPNDPIKTKSSQTLGDFGQSVIGAPGIVTRQATGSAKVSTYQRTITSKAWVFCNEQNYNHGSLGFMSEFYNAAGSFVGNLANRHQ
jgi:hypothetical protein